MGNLDNDDSMMNTNLETLNGADVFALIPELSRASGIF